MAVLILAEVMTKHTATRQVATAVGFDGMLNIQYVTYYALFCIFMTEQSSWTKTMQCHQTFCNINSGSVEEVNLDFNFRNGTTQRGTTLRGPTLRGSCGVIFKDEHFMFGGDLEVYKG